MNEYTLKDTFSKFGHIQDITLKESGYAFISYKHEDDAADAVREMHRRNLFGNGLVNVEYAKSTPRN